MNFNTNITWHDAKIELPTKSGYAYLCITKNDNIIELPYSSQHKKFNTFDDFYLVDRTIEVKYWTDSEHIIKILDFIGGLENEETV